MPLRPPPTRSRRGRSPPTRPREASRVRLVEGLGRVVLLRVGHGHGLDRGLEQHVLGVDEVVPRVLGDLVLRAERDRVERARELAVAAEDAAAHVDLVDPGVPLAWRDAVAGLVLLGDDADAVRGARGRAEGAADALLEPVLVPVQPVASAKARIDRPDDLRVLDGDRLLEQLAERHAEAADGVEGSRAHAATTMAVTIALSVATGSRTFQPKRMSWS